MTEPNFGVELKKKRHELKLSLQDLAYLSGISLYRINQIESVGLVEKKEREALELALVKHEQN